MESQLAWLLAGTTLLIVYAFESMQRRRSNLPEDKFEPEFIGDLTMEKGDMLVCTESYGEFTEGYNYIVRVEYGGALVVWNDEGNPVLAAGLDPRKFKVEERNVDATAAGLPVTCDCKDGINMNCRECNDKIMRDS